MLIMLNFAVIDKYNADMHVNILLTTAQST